MKKSITSPYILTCIGFILISGSMLLVREINKKEFVVKPHQEQVYHTITDEVEASAAIIYNITGDKILAGKNPTEPKSIASLTKLTAALIAFPKLSEEDITVINSEDFNLFATTPIKLGDKWKTRDLLKYSLITSSNRGINAVGRTIEEKTGKSLVEMMNDFVRANNLVQTHFVNPTGLDAHSTLSGSESSAFDLAKIAAIVVKRNGELAQATTKKEEIFYSLDKTRYKAKNTNKLIGVIPEKVVLSKTGFTHIAGGALVMVIEHEDKKIVLIVLDSTRTGRFDDMKKLLDIYKELHTPAEQQTAMRPQKTETP